jgi:hypothetical protein
MDELEEFLEASLGDGEGFAGSSQDCYDRINAIHPRNLPMWDRWHNRKSHEVWDEAFTNDYQAYMNAWYKYRINVKNLGGNFGDHERYQLMKLSQHFEDVGAFWAGA